MKNHFIDYNGDEYELNDLHSMPKHKINSDVNSNEIRIELF